MRRDFVCRKHGLVDSFRGPGWRDFEVPSCQLCGKKKREIKKTKPGDSPGRAKKIEEIEEDENERLQKDS